MCLFKRVWESTSARCSASLVNCLCLHLPERASVCAWEWISLELIGLTWDQLHITEPVFLSFFCSFGDQGGPPARAARRHVSSSGMIRRRVVDAPPGLLVLLPCWQVSVFSQMDGGRLYGGGSRHLGPLISVPPAHYSRRALILL